MNYRVALLLLLISNSGSAFQTMKSSTNDSSEVSKLPGGKYEAGWLHRLVQGKTGQKPPSFFAPKKLFKKEVLGKACIKWLLMLY